MAWLAYTKGIEPYAEYRPASIWRIRGSYSYLHMNVYKAPNSTDIGTAPGIMGASPEHQAMLGTQLDVSKRLQVDADWRFVSTLLPARVSRGIPPPDARVGWRLTMTRSSFLLSGRISRSILITKTRAMACSSASSEADTRSSRGAGDECV